MKPKKSLINSVKKISYAKKQQAMKKAGRISREEPKPDVLPQVQQEELKPDEDSKNFREGKKN